MRSALDIATAGEVYHLVRRLREGETATVSRNRNFDAMSRPTARRAWRIHQRLLGIERELRGGGEVEVAVHADGYRVRIAFPAVRVWREAYLTAEEHALLCNDPTLAERLRPRD